MFTNIQIAFCRFFPALLVCVILPFLPHKHTWIHSRPVIPLIKFLTLLYCTYAHLR